MTDSIRASQRQTAATIQEQTIQIYRYSVYVSFAFVIAGLAIALIRDRAIGTELGSIGRILEMAMDGDPAGFIGIGIGLMILAPIVMLINAALVFFRSGDSRFGWITSSVAAILTLSIIIAFVNG